MNQIGTGQFYLHYWYSCRIQPYSFSSSARKLTGEEASTETPTPADASQLHILLDDNGDEWVLYIKVQWDMDLWSGGNSLGIKGIKTGFFPR
jgi:hypothetical protein